MYARLHFTNGIDCARSSGHHSFTVIASNSHLEWSQPSIWLHMKCANTKLSAATSSEWIQSNYKFMLAKNYYNIAAFVRHSLPVYRIKLAISAIWQWLSVYLSKLVRRRTINGVNFVAFKCERTESFAKNIKWAVSDRMRCVRDLQSFCVSFGVVIIN